MAEFGSQGAHGRGESDFQGLAQIRWRRRLADRVCSSLVACGKFPHLDVSVPPLRPGEVDPCGLSFGPVEQLLHLVVEGPPCQFIPSVRSKLLAKDHQFILKRLRPILGAYHFVPLQFRCSVHFLKPRSHLSCHGISQSADLICEKIPGAVMRKIPKFQTTCQIVKQACQPGLPG
jgi:hypothetical protein